MSTSAHRSGARALGSRGRDRASVFPATGPVAASPRWGGACAATLRARSEAGPVSTLPTGPASPDSDPPPAQPGGPKSGAGMQRAQHTVAGCPARPSSAATPDPTPGPRESSLRAGSREPARGNDHGNDPDYYPHARGPEHPAWSGLLSVIAFGRELLIEAHAEGTA